MVEIHNIYIAKMLEGLSVRQCIYSSQNCLIQFDLSQMTFNKAYISVSGSEEDVSPRNSLPKHSCLIVQLHSYSQKLQEKDLIRL